ncbi:ATP-binding protein [Spirillospora sp. CA-128828]|uniref:ATP-binding protein n=1 Tax=Spirillospora sp. CA-128828 TaxID=3240033 RepID=UPI003D905D12
MTATAQVDTLAHQRRQTLTKACPDSVYLTRALVREALDGWGLAAYESDACQIMGELAGNAATLCEGAEIRAWVSRIDVGVELCVWDAHPGRPELQSPREGAECGRGLIIVQAFASGGWGWCSLGQGKIVWARIAIDYAFMLSGARAAGRPVVGPLPHVDRPTAPTTTR